MSALSNLWAKFSKNKQYRDAFVASHLKRGIPTQIRILLKQRGWTQADLAERSGLTQGAVSRACNPDYGNLTFNNALRIASGLDVAFVGKFVTFSELAKWHTDLSEPQLEVKSFADEDANSTIVPPNGERHISTQNAATLMVECTGGQMAHAEIRYSRVDVVNWFVNAPVQPSRQVTQ